MENGGILKASQILAETEIQVEEITGGYRLLIQGGSYSFRSSPSPSKAGVDSARRVFEEFAEWSGSPPPQIEEGEDDSELESEGGFAVRVREVFKQEAPEQLSKGNRERAAKERGDDLKKSSPERSEEAERSDTPESSEPVDTASAECSGEPGNEAEKDAEWKEKEVERILKALSAVQS